MMNHIKVSDESFKILAEESPNMIFINDMKCVVYANKRCEEVMGYKREEMCSPGFDFRKLIAPEYLKEIEANIKKHMAGEDVEPFEYAIITKNKKRLDAIITTRLINYEGHKAILGIVTDISKYKNMERELEKHRIALERAVMTKTDELQLATKQLGREVAERARIEEMVKEHEIKYRSLIEQIPAVTYISPISSPESPIYVSPQIKSILGFSQEEFVKDPAIWSRCLHAEDYDKVMTHLVVSRVSGRPFNAQYRITRKDGKIIWLHDKAMVIRDRAGRPLFLQGVKFDITEQKKSEEEISTLEKQIEFVLGATKTGLDIIDSDFNVIYIDPVWAKTYGDYRNKKCYQYFMGRNKICEGCGIAEALKTKKVVVKEEVLIKENNRPILVTTIPFKNKEGKWLVAEVNVDIAESKKKEAALKESEERYRELVENANSIILRLDDKGSITFFNEFAEKFFGYKKEEVLGKNCVGTIVPKKETTGRDLEKMILDLARHPERYNTNENENMKKSGDRVWVVWTNKVTKSKDGSGREILCIGSDITDRKTAENEKTRAEAFREVIENAPEAIIITDENGQITQFNKALTNIYGYGNEVLGKLPKMLVPARERKKVADATKECRDKGYVKNIETFVLKKGEGEIPVLINGALLYDNEGNPKNMIGTVTNITDRKRLEKIKDEFVSTASHELRTPLASIKESLSIMTEGMIGTVSEKQKEFLNIAKDNIDRLSRLINDILNYQRLDYGTVKFNIKEHDMAKLAKAAVSEMNMLARNKGLNLETEFEKNLPQVMVDSDKIMQILINLIDNAIKYTVRGKIIIKVSRMKDGVCVSVKDSGCGIDKKDLDHIFDAFFQARHRPYDSDPGSGLGLAIAKRMIEEQGGKIGAESVYGKGSRFYFIMPLKTKKE